MKSKKRLLTSSHEEELLSTLKKRFEENMKRHPVVEWNNILSRIESQPEKLWSLNEMEISGGVPDVIILNKKTQEFCYCDCSPESPSGRRSLCYDRESLDSRKENKPKDNALDVAGAMKIEILSEELYRQLQDVGKFDLKTSSWVLTPDRIRKLGGAIFCDRRYDTVFTYHNGASSYYAARGFRGWLKI
jgi:hypothetical protein